MLVDERLEVRQQAVERVLEARAGTAPGVVRSFSVLEINTDAREYTELIFWDRCVITPPPLLDDLGNEELQAAAAADILELPPLPCHTQAKERFVHEVTTAAEKVVGEERRDGLIRTRVAERQAMPKFGKKAEFKPPN
jgi:hypothetical protein